MNKIFLASDHAGFHLKTFLKQQLSIHHSSTASSSRVSVGSHESSGQKVSEQIIDLGPSSEDRVDYPDFAVLLSHEVLKNPGSRGILICGSGQGMAITANKFKGIRAALCWDEISAQLSREHNDTNVLCIGGRLIPDGLAVLIAEKWLSADFAGGRHSGRVEKMNKLGC